MAETRLILLIPLITFSLLYPPSSAASSSEAYPAVPGAVDTSVISDNEYSPNNSPIRREVYGDGRIIDISHRFRREMPVWDTEEDVLGEFLWLSGNMKNGSLANFSKMMLPIHCGTHVDAPGHVFDQYFDEGFDVDTLDLEVLNGPGLLVDVPKNSNITGNLCSKLSLTEAMWDSPRMEQNGWLRTQT